MSDIRLGMFMFALCPVNGTDHQVQKYKQH